LIKRDLEVIVLRACYTHNKNWNTKAWKDNIHMLWGQ